MLELKECLFCQKDTKLKLVKKAEDVNGRKSDKRNIFCGSNG